MALLTSIIDERARRWCRRFLAAPLLLACLCASGCFSAQHAWNEADAAAATGDFYVAAIEPTVVGYPEPRDPLMALNRAIFAFNDVVYRYVLIPLSRLYVQVVPAPVRTGIRNFFYNLRAPIYVVNHLLQGNPGPAGRNVLRFAINATIGLFGLFDPARAWFNLEREDTNFTATLSRYGAGYGVYLVLPFIGPSDTRNAASLVVDYALHPIPRLADNPERAAIRGFDYFQEYAPSAEHYETLRGKVEDPYIFFRNLYIQGLQRDEEY
jgi:phospholipid-binding lipoprotein MlaA